MNVICDQRKYTVLYGFIENEGCSLLVWSEEASKEMVFKMRWSQPCHEWWERTWGKGEKQSVV